MTEGKPGPKPKPKDQVLSATIGFSVTEAERDRYHVEAAKRGMPLAQLIRTALESLLNPRRR